jgi:hypothetical protein
LPWESYFNAFESRRKFREFWNSHLSSVDEITKAISEYLDILQGTGVNNINGELGALWVAKFECEKLLDDSDPDLSESERSNVSFDSEDEEISSRGAHSENGDVEQKEGRMPFKKVENVMVTLSRSEYTWTPFLVDSPETITMANITTSCLEAAEEQGLGRRCQRGWREGNKFVKIRGYPVLATSLFVNESILESKQLVSKKIRGGCYLIWDTNGLCEKARFSLGDHGELEVYAKPSRKYPVTIMEWQGVIGAKETWNEIKEANVNEEFFGRSRTPHHKEHISGEWETRPLLILIMSKALKPLVFK